MNKEQLKKEIKKALQNNLEKYSYSFYMTKKQMENNTATILIGNMHYKVENENKSYWVNYDIDTQLKLAKQYENIIKEILKDMAVQTSYEIKREYGLDYLYIRLNY